MSAAECRNAWLLGESLAGKTFGWWTVISQAEKPENSTIKLRGTWWLCRCKCGTERIIPRNYLINQHPKSCGCLKPERKRAELKPLDTASSVKPKRVRNVVKGLSLNFEELAKTTVCDGCGATFERLSGDWAYKSSINGKTCWFCTWKCLQNSRQKKKLRGAKSLA